MTSQFCKTLDFIILENDPGFYPLSESSIFHNWANWKELTGKFLTECILKFNFAMTSALRLVAVWAEVVSTGVSQL